MWHAQEFSTAEWKAQQKHLSVHFTARTPAVFCLYLSCSDWLLSPNDLFFIIIMQAGIFFLCSFAFDLKVLGHIVSCKRDASCCHIKEYASKVVVGEYPLGVCQSVSDDATDPLLGTTSSPHQCLWLQNVLCSTFLKHSYIFWSLSDNNPQIGGVQSVCVCVFPIPVVPCTVSHNWALHTPTCHTGSHCHWYYRPLSPVSLCLATVAVALVPACVCLTGTEGLCRVLCMTWLTGTESYVFVGLVNIKQLLRWPDIDPYMVFFFKEMCTMKAQLAKHTCFACSAFLSFLYFCPDILLLCS